MRKKTVVLVGGCFDILHLGHIIFLEKAKKMGDKLVVLLESDQKVKILKGGYRPIHTQKERARILLALKAVDQVVCLPYMETAAQYDQLIARIKPDIIAVTKAYPHHYHQRVAKLVGVKLKYVPMIGKYSTSNILDEN